LFEFGFVVVRHGSAFLVLQSYGRGMGPKTINKLVVQLFDLDLRTSMATPFRAGPK
jgi:hypothetical protein